ncbi:MAG: YraN family protein [Caldilineaceae bacterium]
MPIQPPKSTSPSQASSRPDPRRRLGDAGEALATQALAAAGLTIVARNWRCALGELDIIAQEIAPDYASGVVDATWLVVVEVRTRRGDRFGTARQSLTPRKQAKLREVASEYVQTVAWQGPWRIDLVAIQMDHQGHLLAIDHIRHAVTG